MPLPVVLAALGITPAVWMAVLGAIRLISWIIGIVYVSSYVKDTVTGITEGQEQAGQDQTIEGILARTDLTAEQKKDLIIAYLEEKAGTEAKPRDWTTTALYLVSIIAGAYVLGQFIGGKKYND